MNLPDFSASVVGRDFEAIAPASNLQSPNSWAVGVLVSKFN
ncbi:MAG: hypothetical protein VKJ46_07155 [Leptolyngbyaceae bacterium]|nr:hypothetical protein [Leptolyngbyaceae bacterium]